MADFQFFSNDFFDKLFNKNHPEQGFVEVQELIKVSKELPVELKRFHQKSKTFFIVLGIVLLALGVISPWVKGLEWGVIICIVLAVFFAFTRIMYKPEKVLKDKLKRYRKKVSEGIVIQQSNPKKTRIYRSKKDVAIMGVAAGIAEYFGVPSIIFRMVFLGLLFTTSGFFLFFYILAASLIPEEPIETDE